MIKKGITIHSAKILMLGITFKENCPDVRNTKAVDVIKTLEDYGIIVTTFDPWANPAEVKHEYNLKCYSKLAEQSKYDAIVLTVAHKEFLNFDFGHYLKNNGVIYDVKGILTECDNRL
jgi:UDP-N-acetyl-D-galactosamine dehydrogenase